ncbi:S9 family peptidase [Arthrobacter castelli]|uniref:S9 family peptidase n=1 Tax=Arthrobacter castelli TaxID=271431 RepID=UPI00042429DA|nr:S9 family peptidase [Arthrobacter castelli]
MKAKHLHLLNSVSAPTVHPSGDRAVVAVTRPDFDGDTYVGQLWEAQLDPAGADARRISRGFRDTSPKFSPDGATLAFLRAAQGDKPQLHVMDASGSEAQALTEQHLGVNSFEWSADSTQIVYTARVAEHGRYGTVDGVGAGAEDARHIDTLKFRMNGTGYTSDKRNQLFLVNLPALDEEPPVEPVGRAKEERQANGDEAFTAVPPSMQLTDADADHDGPVFSPDGQQILFAASLHAERDTDLRSDIYSIALDGSGRQQLTNLSGPIIGASDARISADGKWLFYLASELSQTGIDFVARNEGLYAAPIYRPAEAKRLTDPETIDLGGTAGGLQLIGPDSVLVANNTRGAVELLQVGADGGTEVLAGGSQVMTGAGAGGGAVVVSYTDPETAGDVAVAEADGLRRLTDFSARLRDEAGVTPVREVTYHAADGYPVHGWVMLPEGEGPHPVLLNIHGGPYAQYGWGLFDEAQVYVDAGYAVLLSNPRGAAGYGQRHGRAIKGAMGSVDLMDVLGFLEGALAEFGRLDHTRLGVMGGSYGGYLTAWTICQDHRFTAAIIERGYLDPPSFVGSSDIGWFFSNEYTGSDPEQVANQNPFAHIGKVQTPALVIHSEEDLRCPLEQAHRYYTALKQRGIETEMVVFPGENHELSRAGTPHHRRQRFEAILSWWAKHLPTAQNHL